MKRVVVFTHAGGSPYHGPNTRWYFLGRSFLSSNIETHIVTSASFHKYFKPPSFNSLFKVEIIDGIFYHWLKSLSYKNRGFVQIVNQFLYILNAFFYLPHFFFVRLDYIVASSPHPFSFFPAFLLAKIKNKPLIFEVRDLWPSLLVQLRIIHRYHPYTLLLKFTEYCAVSLCDYLVSVKEGDIHHFISDYSLDKSKFFYVPNGFLPLRSLCDTSNLPISFLPLKKSSSFIVGYIGSLSNYYNLTSFLEYAKSFSSDSDYNILFVIVGSGPQEKSILEFIDTYSLSNILFFKAVPKEAVLPIIELFDLCYLGLKDLSVHEFGISCNKLYEYMFSAKPILGCYKAYYDPVSKFDLGHSSPPSQFDNQVSFIKELYSSPALRNRFSLNSSQAFETNFHFDIVSKEYLQIFASLSSK